MPHTKFLSCALLIFKKLKLNHLLYYAFNLYEPNKVTDLQITSIGYLIVFFLNIANKYEIVLFHQKFSRWRGVQAVSRHKYIYVIGSVLLIDILFLGPYSGIQRVAFLQINNIIEISHGSTLIRWWLQVLIGVHSVCQPLCYFRMNEFRRLACCIGRSSFNRTKSLSQLNRSFGKNIELLYSSYLTKFSKHSLESERYRARSE